MNLNYLGFMGYYQAADKSSPLKRGQDAVRKSAPWLK